MSVSVFLNPWRDPRLRWLRSEVAIFRTELESQKERDPGNSVYPSALRFLGQAEQSCRQHDVDSGWTHLYRAQEELAATQDLHTLGILAQTLLEEIRIPGRLAAWRVETIKKLLSDAGYMPQRDRRAQPSPTAEADGRICRDLVVQALKVRNHGIAHEYWRLAIVRHYQRMLIVVGAPVLALVIVLLVVDSTRIAGEVGWATSGTSCVMAVLLGILGAITSAAQRSTRVRQDHIAVQLGSHVNSFSRIPIGAVAGLTVWLFTLATAEGPAINTPNLLLAAFGAGFAERLIVQGQPDDKNDTEPARNVQLGDRSHGGLPKS